MKKRLLGMISIGALMLGMSSCTIISNETVITRIAEEVEVNEIQSSVTEVYKKVVNGCVGIYASNGKSASSGSGVIYKYENNAYYVVTNAHVVKDYTTFKIYNGKYYEASLVGYDEKNDIGVLTFTLELDDNTFTINNFMDYDTTDLISVGQTALATGCPLGLENLNTLTTGVISSVNKTEIITDCAINPGNSGGGLFNLEGRLIGLIYQKTVWTTSDGERIPADGRGYAIPLTTIKKCVSDIEEQKDVIKRPLLGITITIVNSKLTDYEAYKQYKDYLPVMDQESFMVVTGLNDTNGNISNAGNAGVKANDIILKANGNEITCQADLSAVLYLLNYGDTITLTIYRQGEELTIPVLLKD